MNVQTRVHVLRTFVPHLLVRMHQKENIAVEITAKNASVNEP
jgi:DNA polymerase IIIc chi subunit